MSSAVLVNGETVPLSRPTPLLTVVQQTMQVPAGREAAPETGVAVAVNAEVVPRNAWSSTMLADGDQVEVLSAVPGG